MSRLIEIGLVDSRKEGKFVKYYIKVDISDLVILLKSYHPSIWDKLSERLAELFLGITHATGASEMGRGEYMDRDGKKNTVGDTNINEKLVEGNMEKNRDIE